MGFLGIFVFLVIGFLLSSNRKAIDWRTIAWGVLLQWIFAFIVLIIVLTLRPSGLMGERVADRA